MAHLARGEFCEGDIFGGASCEDEFCEGDICVRRSAMGEISEKYQAESARWNYAPTYK